MRIIVITTAIVTSLAFLFALVASKPESPGAGPAKKETEAIFADFTMKLPEGWTARTGNDGVSYAHTQPCAPAGCNNVTVYGSNVLKDGKWQERITNGYACSNKDEKPGVLTPRSAQAIGNHDAQYFTVPLCGVSNSEMLAVWYIPLPGVMVVAYDNASYTMSDLSRRLKEARWTAAA